MFYYDLRNIESHDDCYQSTLYGVRMYYMALSSLVVCALVKCEWGLVWPQLEDFILSEEINLVICPVLSADDISEVIFLSSMLDDCIMNMAN